MEALHSSEIRAPAAVQEMDQLRTAQPPRREATTAKLSLDLFAAEGELATDGINTRGWAPTAKRQVPAASRPIEIDLSGNDEVEATFEERAVPGEPLQEGYVIPSQVTEGVWKVTGPLLQIVKVALHVDGQHSSHDLDREGEAVQERREARDHQLLLRLPLQPEGETSNLEHGAVLAAEQTHDVVLNRLQSKVGGLDAGWLSHDRSSCQAILGASSSQLSTSPPSGSGSRGCQTLTLGTAA